MSAVNQPMPEKLITRCISSPFGLVEIGVEVFVEELDEKGVEITNQKPILDKPIVEKLWYIEFLSHSNQLKSQSVHSNQSSSLLDLAEQQLNEYFNGKKTDFSELLKHQSYYGTPFQQTVWKGLTEIPYGQIWSYGQLANHINNPKAVRAVGAANGKNPLAVVVPCHRVIGANGTLTGYAGGLELKQQLLNFETGNN